MNTSFRTAFWAMCLGLTVPMVLFIGVEMTSGGRAARNPSVTASDHRGSLRSYWEKSASRAGGRESPSNLARGKSGASARTATSSDKLPRAIASQPPGKGPRSAGTSPETADAGVTLDPQLESDPAAAEALMGRDRRIPAVATGQHPSVEILQDPDEKSHDAREIHERLDSIQQQLDRLAQTLAAQAEREPPVDPVQQTIELLRQLRQARELEEPVAPCPSPTPPETDDQKPGPGPENKGAGDRPEIKPSKPAASGPPVRKSPASGQQGAAKKPRPVTKIYRPRFVSATVLRATIEPMLTDKIGKVAAADVTPGDSAPATAGDTSATAASALVVRDLPEVLREIDRLVLELDVPALPVVIEATAITLRLSGVMPHGIDLQGLNVTGQPFAITPTDGALSAPPAAGRMRTVSISRALVPVSDGQMLTHGFGLKCGVLRGDPQAFLGILRTMTEARRLDSWQLNALDRQTAQLVLNDRFGPEASVKQASSGTILKIRPTVAEGGLVRLDVQRERAHNAALAVSQAAALTSQISLHEGETAVMGGFFADHLATHTHRTPYIGEVPLVGRLFNETATVRERTETIVLLTPHVVRLPPPAEGVARGKPHPKSPPVGRPVLKETAEKRGAGRTVLKETAEKRADKGPKPVQQAIADGAKRPAEAAIRRVESPPAPAPAPATRQSAPYAPRRLPPAEKAAARPIDDARPADKAARPEGKATDDSLDAIPVLTLPPEIEPLPVVRPFGAPPP